MKKKTICAVQHVSCETLGLIAGALKQQGFAVNLVRPFRGERIPRGIGDYDGLVVMGGPMGVYEQDRYPFLRQELRLIERALAESKPILGVCLGSQLLAAALGAPVTPGRRKEIGWHPVTLTEAAARDALWRGLGRSFVGYHWHGDVFELPRGAVSLARSELTRCQAFGYGASAYGILFHLEVSREMVTRMTRRFRAELLQAGVDAGPILSGNAQHLAPLQKIGHTVFERWAEQAAGSGGAALELPGGKPSVLCDPSVMAEGAGDWLKRISSLFSVELAEPVWHRGAMVWR